MDNPKIVLNFDLATYLVSVEAPDLPIDFVMSMLKDALRQCENTEKIMVASQVGMAAAKARADEARTGQVLRNVKLQ